MRNRCVIALTITWLGIVKSNCFEKKQKKTKRKNGTKRQSNAYCTSQSHTSQNTTETLHFMQNGNLNEWLSVDSFDGEKCTIKHKLNEFFSSRGSEKNQIEEYVAGRRNANFPLFCRSPTSSIVVGFLIWSMGFRELLPYAFQIAIKLISLTVWRDYDMWMIFKRETTNVAHKSKRTTTKLNEK